MSAPHPMPRWISAFLEAQAAEHGAAQNTRLAYGRDLVDFSDWLAHRSLHFATANQDVIEGYLIDCDARGLARTTRARRLSAIRQLFRFAYDEGWRADNPALKLSGPGREKRLPGTLSEAEVDALLTAARTAGRPADRLRNICLMELLYATGLRVSELVGLPVAAARGDPRMLLVTGKGGKERMVPLSTPARAALAEWIRARDAAEADAAARSKSRHIPSRHLFPSRGREGHLTRQRFFLLVKEMAQAGGVDPSK
ncbi:recombinase XerD, partial [Thioclava sp. BHET1]